MKSSKWLAASGEGAVRLLSEMARISSSPQGLGTKGNMIPHPLGQGTSQALRLRRDVG